jgi:hypothetical protein
MHTTNLPRAARMIVRAVHQALPMRSTLAAGLAGTAAALSLGVAQAATLTVTSLADSGAGSLRDAITAANASVGTADTIKFGVSGTIVLASRLPDIDDDLTIDGKGASIAISGNNAVQVMFVSAGKTLELANLTIANGYCASPCSGGGILNVGTLKVTDSVFSGNSALLGGAIHNFGSLDVGSSTFLGNSARIGGAIHNFDTLTVADSRFVGNSAARTGGAIHNFDTLTVTGSTFAGNSAAVASDNIANRGQGVAQALTDSTIVCNSVACLAAGGGFLDNAGATLVLHTASAAR